jgi:glyceraldehyde-3-phosphate dehydrogenase/erythrose-4-phosphate dehydrogenase
MVVYQRNNHSIRPETSIIETTSLSNNDKFLDYNAAYLSVPILITLTNNSATTTGLAPPATLLYTKSLGCKQTFLYMIHSITVDLNGQSMV